MKWFSTSIRVRSLVAGACFICQATACASDEPPIELTTALLHPTELFAADTTLKPALIVNNPAPDPDRPAFHVAAPVARYGGRNDDSLHRELWDVVDAVFTSSGRLIASMEAGREIRAFEPGSSAVKTIGRRGEGPGEFNSASQFYLTPGDSLMVNDRGFGRIMLFSPRDSLVHMTSMAKRATCCFPDGHFLTSITDSREKYSRQWPERRPLTDWFISQLSAPQPRRILSLASDDLYIHVSRQSWMAGYVSRIPPALARVPFARIPQLAIAGSQIVYASTDAYEYRTYSAGGELLRVVRAALPPTLVTKEDIAAARPKFTAAASNEYERRSFEDAFDKLELPKTLPAFSLLRTEEDGSVWIRNYDAQYIGQSALQPGEWKNQWWARFDSSGTLLGTLRIPDGHSVVRFTHGHVILRYVEARDGFTYLSVHPVRNAEGR